MSSSLDATLCLLDVDRGKLAATVALHRKGVRCFGYSPAFSLVARWGGREVRRAGVAPKDLPEYGLPAWHLLP